MAETQKNAALQFFRWYLQKCAASSSNKRRKKNGTESCWFWWTKYHCCYQFDSHLRNSTDAVHTVPNEISIARQTAVLILGRNTGENSKMWHIYNYYIIERKWERVFCFFLCPSQIECKGKKQCLIFSTREIIYSGVHFESRNYVIRFDAVHLLHHRKKNQTKWGARRA